MYTLIESIEDLEVLNQELSSKLFVAVDTEFRRTSKNNMRLALLQVNDEDETFLIDALKIPDPEEHASFLFNSSVIKILHSCKEDLEAIYSWTNQEMVNIFDTQISEAFLGGDYSISYQGLVENRLGIILDKKETRSNWTRRPLSNSQLKYAALDVEYLIYLYKEQKKELKDSNKLEWLYQDIDKLVSSTFDPQYNNLEVDKVLTRSEEDKLLKKLHEVIVEISFNTNINPTLFFSKKSQKEFLRLVFSEGLDKAFQKTTFWRETLLKKKLRKLLEN